MPTRIEWTDETVNVVSGCTPVSEGCEHCYAERTAPRLAGRFGYPADEPFRVTLHPDRLARLFKLRKGKRIFLDSMGDLFHADVPDEYIAGVLGAVSVAGQHDLQVLTKRPERMAEFFRGHTLLECQKEFIRSPRYDVAWKILLKPGFRLHALDARSIDGAGHYRWPLPNLWLGATAENQARWEERRDHLRRTPAAVQFLSAEPLLGPLELSDEDLRWLDWVIVGGESGPGARPMQPDWPRKVRDDCAAAGVPYFFKHWGEYAVCSPEKAGGRQCVLLDRDGEIYGEGWGRNGWADPDAPATAIWMARVGKKAAGDLLDGQRHREFPKAA